MNYATPAAQTIPHSVKVRIMITYVVGRSMQDVTTELIFTSHPRECRTSQLISFGEKHILQEDVCRH